MVVEQDGAGVQLAGAGRAPVLVVEDDPEVRQLLRWILEEQGLTVDTAADAEEALIQAARRPPALVLLDLDLLGDPGETVAERLRSLHGSAPPVLVVSSSSSRWRRGHDIDAFGSLGKPFDVDQLVAAVWQILGKS